MAKTVVGLFDTREQAEQAVQALTNRGVAREDVSVVANNRDSGMGTDADTSSGDSAAAGAATGAIGGGVLGGTLGLLVGLGALAIPGIGPVIAAGPIAAALGAAGTTALVGAGIGAVSGGLLGALVGAGIPEEDANYYAEGVRRGGTLVMARVDDAMTGSAYNIMQQYGAVDVEDRGAEWRQTGWERFDPDSNEWERSSKVGTAGGTAAGAATGAALGSVGGPVGTAVGGLAGAAVGAATGAAGDAVGREANEEARGESSTTSYTSTSSTSGMGTSGTSSMDSGSTTYSTTGSTSMGSGSMSGPTEPVMTDANDSRPSVPAGSAGATRRRGGRIYGEGSRYDWDDATNTAIAVGAANTAGITGSSGTVSNVALGGAAAAAAANDMDTTNSPRGEYRGDVDRGDSPAEDWQESSKVGTATGTAAGAATGAAIGSVGGPVGTVIGGIAGAVTGAATGAAGDAAGEATEDSLDYDEDGNVIDREATNDVGGRKGQVRPSE